MSTRILIPRNRILRVLLAAALALPCAAAGQGRAQDSAVSAEAPPDTGADREEDGGADMAAARRVAANSAAAARGGGSAFGWLAGTTLAAFALLFGGQVAVVVLLNRMGREMRTFNGRLSIKERPMTMQRDPIDSAGDSARPVPARPLVPATEGGPGPGAFQSSAGGGSGERQATPHAVVPDERPGGNGDEHALSDGGVQPHSEGPGGEQWRDDGTGDGQPRNDGTGDGSPRVVIAIDPRDGAQDEAADDASGEGAPTDGTASQEKATAGPEPVGDDPPHPPPNPEVAETRPDDSSTETVVPPTYIRAMDTDEATETPAWPGGDHALYVRGRERLAQVQEERGEKDRARLEVAAARFDRRRAWVLGLHEAWENDVDFAYLRALEKPGAGVVKDPYVMLYPVSEHDWKATREELRRLADHIGALPEAPDPHWPALLPRTGMRSSVDFDLRVQPPPGTPPAVEFHARRLLATLLVNLKTLHRARAELAKLVHWLAEATPGEARLADVSPQALAILDAVCAPGSADEEREAAVDVAVQALEAVDSENFRVVQGTEQRAEKLEQGYRAFLKVLLRVVDGVDRARALHHEAAGNGAGGEPWLAAWGEILADLDDLLVRRVLEGRLEITPIPCEEGDPLDTDLHNPLGGEPVPGVEKDRVRRVETRGFAYAEDGALRVVRPVDVIAAVPAA